MSAEQQASDSEEERARGSAPADAPAAAAATDEGEAAGAAASEDKPDDEVPQTDAAAPTIPDGQVIAEVAETAENPAAGTEQGAEVPTVESASTQVSKAVVTQTSYTGTGTEPQQQEVGTVESGETVTEGSKVTKEETVTEEPSTIRSSTKPSFTLHIRGLPADVEMSELEMRLQRFGDLVGPLQDENGVVVAKFSRTQHAYQAREKLNGSDAFGPPLQVDFGPQDAEHYNRGKKKMQGRGRKDFLDGEGMSREVAPRIAPGSNQKGRGMRAWNGGSEPGGSQPGGSQAEAKGSEADDKEGETPKRKQRALGDEAAGEAPPDARARTSNFGLTAPTKPVSRWSRNLSFEEQLEDFMKMPRQGMYNRYLVLGKLPPELRTGEAIWRLMHPVQRDIVQIEMLLCFGKPVAHVALRSATAAAAMHRLCGQVQANLTVAFAPPRKASATLWLGNVDDFVPRKELEALLGEYGRLVNGMRYLPARTCAFASFTEAGDAMLARNALYGLEVQRNQYLNVDFVEESDTYNEWGSWGQQPPWGQPWGGQWGAAGAARPLPPARPGDRRRGEDAGRPGAPWIGQPPPPPASRRSPMRLLERSKRERHRSRTPSDREASPQQERPTKRRKRKEVDGSPPRVAKQAARSDSEEQPTQQQAVAPKGEKPAANSGKAKVKLYKMREFCCNIVANYVKGKEAAEPLALKLHIDQRTKIEHCHSHMERAGTLATVWHLSAADRRDCAAYDALCDYFVEKQRVGLVQTPGYYVYIVPPTEKYLKELQLPTSNFVVGLQIPIKK